MGVVVAVVVMVVVVVVVVVFVVVVVEVNVVGVEVSGGACVSASRGGSSWSHLLAVKQSRAPD